jgi:hypothetical protein
MDIFVHHFHEFFLAPDPFAFDGIGKAAEDVETCPSAAVIAPSRFFRLAYRGKRD